MNRPPMTQALLPMLFPSLLAAVLTLFSGCGDKTSLVLSERPVSYFTPLANGEAGREQSLSDLESKTVIYSDKKPMRFVLFKDKRAYYEIDKLGTGMGTWKYENGGVSVYAARPIFDIHVVLTATSDSNDQLRFRYYDRHGLQDMEAKIRDGATEAAAPALQPFSSYRDDI